MAQAYERHSVWCSQKWRKVRSHFFSDLNDAEKRLLVDDAEKSLVENASYLTFEHKLAELIDQSLLDLVESEASLSSASPEEIIVKRAAEGVRELLKNSQGGASTLSLLLNQELPPSLRKEIWQMKLAHPEARRSYELRTSGRRANTISKADGDIATALETVFDSHFPSLAENNEGIFMAAKTVLSYLHVLQSDLEDYSYFLVLPFVIVYGTRLDDITCIVEGYSALMKRKRPRVRVLTAEPSEIDERLALAQKFSDGLEARVPGLYAHLAEMMSQLTADPTAESAIPGWADKLPLQMVIMVVPAIERLFVGTLNWDACLYAWDQFVIVGFEHLVVEYCVAICALIESYLINCTTLQSLERTFRTRARLISSRKLMETV